jgi:hypothetical protein
MAKLWKDVIEGLKKAGKNPPKEAVDQLNSTFEKRVVEINARYPDLAQFNSQAFTDQSIFSDEAFQAGSGDYRGIIEWLHFERHRVPFKHDLREMKNGNWDASLRVQRTFGDAEKLRCKRGPILPFKGNLEHSNIFESFWGLGIERLTEEELADFFDKYCPCGLEAHDPNALTKHRRRFEKGLLAAIEESDERSN